MHVKTAMQWRRASEVCTVFRGSPCPASGLWAAAAEQRCASDACSKRNSLLAAGYEEKKDAVKLALFTIVFKFLQEPCRVSKAAPPACREDAVKLALFVGGFTGSYHLLRGGLQQWMNQSHTQACFTAGCLAGKLWGSLSGFTWLHSSPGSNDTQLAGNMMLSQLIDAARERGTDRATLRTNAGSLFSPALAYAARHPSPVL